MALTIHCSPPASIFGLSGMDENSASIALGWELEKSPCFRAALVAAIFGKPLDAAEAVISLQKHGEVRGFTDVEIHAGRRFHAIIEAKRWWDGGPVFLSGWASLYTTAIRVCSANSVVRRVGRQVTNYRDVKMAMRWAAAGFLEAEKAFRRLRGDKNIPALVHAHRPILSVNTKMQHNYSCHRLEPSTGNGAPPRCGRACSI